MDPEGSFSTYRKQIAAAGVPSLPYLYSLIISDQTNLYLIGEFIWQIMYL